MEGPLNSSASECLPPPSSPICPSPEILPGCFPLEVISAKTNVIRWDELEIMLGKGPLRGKYPPRPVLQGGARRSFPGRKARWGARVLTSPASLSPPPQE